MKRAYVLAVMAILGVCLSIFTILYDNRPLTVPSPAILPPNIPYSSYIAGAGIIEARTGNIAIGTPVAGVVMDLFVKVGDHVDAGQPLFKIDARDLQAQLLTANARVKEADAALQKPRHQLNNAENLRRHDPNAISSQDLSNLRDEAILAEAVLELAKAQVAQIKMEIDRHTVRAAVAGVILQLKMRLGEYVESSGISAPLLLLGGDKRLNLRVDVDEHDAWRMLPGAEAMAFVRGQPSLKIPLHYEYTEPYIIPKTALTGQTTERTDTRVLQVIYSFEHAELPVYVGQQMDVFIQAPPITAASRETRS